MPKGWGKRLILGLRVALAASTVVVTSALISQEPARSETRWLLAFLTTSLFVVSVVEAQILRRPSVATIKRPKEEQASSWRGEASSALASREQLRAGESLSRGESIRDDEDKVRQLSWHRTDYVSTISHELRTPLTSIRGFAQLLARGHVPRSVLHTYATTILEEADRLSLIVDDIVDLTRMESTILKLRKDSIRTEDLVSALVERLRPAHAPERLVTVVGRPLPQIRGDRDMIVHALEQVLLSAIAHSMPDTMMELCAEARDGAVALQMRFEVLPVRLDRMQRAIEDLWRCGSDGVATRLGRGDVSLYVARNLIEAHGGRIAVDGIGEREGRITITLPC